MDIRDWLSGCREALFAAMLLFGFFSTGMLGAVFGAGGACESSVFTLTDIPAWRVAAAGAISVVVFLLGAWAGGLFVLRNLLVKAAWQDTLPIDRGPFEGMNPWRM